MYIPLHQSTVKSASKTDEQARPLTSETIQNKATNEPQNKRVQ